MKPKPLQLQGVTSAERHVMIGRIKAAFQDGDAFITGFQMFSNVAVCVTFEVSSESLPKLKTSLVRESVLNDASLEKVNNRLVEIGDDDMSADINGTLNVTFVHNEPDLRIKAPPIPG